MARILIGALLVLGGIVLSVGAFQDYEEGSCGAGECQFASRLDDPVFLVIGILAIAAGVLLFLDKLPFMRRRELPPPAPKNHERRNGNGFLLPVAMQVADTSYMVDSGGVDWLTFVLGAAVVGGVVWFVWNRRRKRDSL